MKLSDLLLASILLAFIGVPTASQASAITCEEAGNGDEESFDLVGDYWGTFFIGDWAYFWIGKWPVKMRIEDFPINEPENGDRMMARNCSHDPDYDGGFICQDLVISQ